MPGYRTTTAVPPPGLAAPQLRAEPALRLLPRLVAFTLAAGDLAVNLGLLTRPFGPFAIDLGFKPPDALFRPTGVGAARRRRGSQAPDRSRRSLPDGQPDPDLPAECRASLQYEPWRERSPPVTSVLWLEREEFDRHVASGVDSAHECQRLAPKCLLDDRPELVLECV